MKVFKNILIIGTLLLSCSKEEAECYCQVRELSVNGNTTKYLGNWVGECEPDKISYFDGGYYEIKCNDNF